MKPVKTDIFFSLFEGCLGALLCILGCAIAVAQASRASSPLGVLLGILFICAGVAAMKAGLHGLKDDHAY